MTNLPDMNRKFDRTNAIFAAFVFLGSFIVYAMTVQRTFSFWDCGEFIACAYILGIPHPPGTPFFILVGRVLSLIPFVEDISYRINYISVLGSAFTALFSYLITVRLIKALFPKDAESRLNRAIAYIGGVAGGFFVAFSATNWANSVEAEVYGLALALLTCILWLTLRYHEQRGTHKATKMLILALYLAMLGVGVHMTVFLVVPVVAIFFILKDNAEARDYLYVAGFVIVELLLIILFSNVNNGATMFKLVTLLLGLVLLGLLYKKINWGIMLAIVSISSIMFSFSLYIHWVSWVSIIAMILLGVIGKSQRWNVHWKTGLAILVIGFLGLSTHAYIPIRSEHNPRIDENNPSRDFTTFVDFLDRKQYGQESMVDRMFTRRGLWSNQFGRHPNMGFWSYFEEQYSEGGVAFLPFLALGVIGLAAVIRQRQDLGMPFLALLMVTTVGLVLYMNFADGTQYSGGQAYLEVRNRDYFFTPGFVAFGIAMGVGIGALIHYARTALAKSKPSMQRTVVYAGSILALLPIISLADNYHQNDRSNNYIPYNYSKNILDSCPENSILFTSGDNDTFPIWCLQEVYDYRKDIRVVNLSLLNTDWYVHQMKNRYDVPISLTDEQILWYPFEVRPGQWIARPDKPFYDRPRQRQTYLLPSRDNTGRVVKVQDMMVDEIVIENRWRDPICFSALPYAESPLNLRDRSEMHGVVYHLEREPDPTLIDVEHSYDLVMNHYRWGGFQSSEVYRDDNATGVFIAMGVAGLRTADQLLRQGDTTRAMEIFEKLETNYPEYWQVFVTHADIRFANGDTTGGLELLQTLHDTLVSFYASNEENLFYLQDLGLAKYEIGQKTGDQAMIDEGIDLMWEAFNRNENSNYAFRKLVTSLSQTGRFTELQQAARQFAQYGANLNDPVLQQIMSMGGGAPPTGGATPPPPPPPTGGGGG